VIAHNGGSHTAGSSGVTPGGTAPSQQVQAGGGSNGQPTLCCVTPPVPEPRPLHPKAINRAFQVYLDALLHHDLRALQSATCPRLRRTEVGVALHGKYVRAWSGKPYDIQPDLDFVTVSALVKFTDPATGDDAGQAVYSWNVQRSHRGRYSVCGFLS
jgi:hypothetical protein